MSARRVQGKPTIGERSPTGKWQFRPVDVYQAHLKKNQANHQRQESGYAKKDEADPKHI